MDKYRNVIDELIKFRDDRDWEQFHDSKNLAVAISIEASELNELFLWKSPEQSDKVEINRKKKNWRIFCLFPFY